MNYCAPWSLLLLILLISQWDIKFTSLSCEIELQLFPLKWKHMLRVEGPSSASFSPCPQEGFSHARPRWSSSPATRGWPSDRSSAASMSTITWWSAPIWTAGSRRCRVKPRSRSSRTTRFTSIPATVSAVLSQKYHFKLIIDQSKGGFYSRCLWMKCMYFLYRIIGISGIIKTRFKLFSSNGEGLFLLDLLQWLRHPRGGTTPLTCLTAASANTATCGRRASASRAAHTRSSWARCQTANSSASTRSSSCTTPATSWSASPWATRSAPSTVRKLTLSRYN